MSNRTIHFGKLAFALLIAQGAGLVGNMFAAESIRTWYTTLAKPTFNPPNWVFGPVWMILYILIGIALYIVWTRHVGGHIRTLWLRIFWVQLILNALWSSIFFGLQNPMFAFYEILALLASIGFLVGLSLAFDRRVTVLLTPYLVWVFFAMYLNYTIWQMNQ